MSFHVFLIYFSSFSSILPVIIGGMRYSYVIKNKPYKWLFLYSVFIFLLELVTVYVSHYKINTHFIINIWGIIELIILYNVYSFVLPQKKKRLYLIISIYVLVSIGVLLLKSTNIISDISNSLSAFLLTGLALYYFLHLLRTLESTNLLKFPFFWINSGILLNFSAIFLVYLFSHYILFNEHTAIRQLWDIVYGMLIVYRIFLAIGLWYSKPQ
jgi:hypothetical protein